MFSTLTLEYMQSTYLLAFPLMLVSGDKSGNPSALTTRTCNFQGCSGGFMSDIVDNDDDD